MLETALKKNNVEIKDFVGDADIKNEADLLMDMLNNVSLICTCSNITHILCLNSRRLIDLKASIPFEFHKLITMISVT